MVEPTSKKGTDAAGKVSNERRERARKVAALKRKRDDIVKKRTSDVTDEIEALEKEIVASPRGYNQIVALLEYLKGPDKTTISTAATSLCRAFVKLMAKGELSKRKRAAEAQVRILEWLREQYKRFLGELCGLLGFADGDVQEEVLWMLMRLVKAEAEYLAPPGEEAYFPHKTFEKVVAGVVYAEGMEGYVRMGFAEKYLDAHDDVRYSFFVAVKSLIPSALESPSTLPQFTSSAVILILSLRNLPTADTPPFAAFLAITPPPPPSSKNILTLHMHRRLLQETVLLLLRLPTITPHILTILPHTPALATSFTHPHTLMDFLTDAYSTPDLTTSILALSGLFHLIKTRNLDYPHFYRNLYALLTRDLLHLRSRSRFFRLLDEFLLSTHLPASLVASFVKRLARLSLTAPPGAIVVIVPLVYNLLRRHPACSFMLHRESVLTYDPFDEREPDPTKTFALDSCLWELESLRTHWQPNVATLAGILAQQFTKVGYDIEDFLDHSYASMFTSEMSKKVNADKPPVVEYVVPKGIFYKDEGEDEGEELSAGVGKGPLLSLWEF